MQDEWGGWNQRKWLQEMKWEMPERWRDRDKGGGERGRLESRGERRGESTHTEGERVETVKTCVHSRSSQHRTVSAGGCCSSGSPLAPMTRYDHFPVSPLQPHAGISLFVCMDDTSLPHIHGFLTPQLI